MNNARHRLADLLRSARLGRNPPLTQVELAARLDRAQATVSAWESGKQIPAIPVLRDLSRELNIPAHVLLDLAGDAALEEFETADKSEVRVR